MVYPTRMGLWFAVIGFFLYLSSLQLRSGLLFLVIGILAGCYVINFFEARRAARHLDVIPPPTLTGTEGQPATGCWEVANLSGRALGLAEVLLPEPLWARGVRQWRRFTRQPAGLPGVFGVLLRVGAIPPGERVQVTPDVRLPRRGVYPFRRLRLTSSYPFGLVRWERALDAVGEFVVCPAVYVCAAPPAAGFEPMVGGRYHGRHRSSSGDRFSGVRPAQPQDPLKLIHWPSSSKGQGLMVKEFDEELSGRVALVLDCEPGDAPDGAPWLDWQARAAASLLLAALDEGHHVEFATLASEATYSVPPSSDGAPVLEALARAMPAPGGLTAARLSATLARLPSRAALAFVLSQVNDEFRAFVVDELLPAQRRVSLFLPAPLRGRSGLSEVPEFYFAANGPA